MDLKAFAREGTPKGMIEFFTAGARKPLIAAIEGFALAGGLELALSCDLLVVAENVKLGIPEVGVGLFAGGGALLRLPSRVGSMRAMELALTGDPMTAQQALEWGLVSRVTEKGQAVDVAMELAERIARNAPLAVAASKEIIRTSHGLTEEEAWKAQGALFQRGVHVGGRQGGIARLRREAGAELVGRAERWPSTSASRPSSRRSAPARAPSSTAWSSRPSRIHEENLAESDRKAYFDALIGMRKQAQDAGLWLPHMPEEWGGMGLGHVELAMVQAEAAKTSFGPWVLNCQAPDEGNMHTLLHWGTDEQKEKYLRPLCDGTAWSCFAMTEPEVAGSDPDADPDEGLPGRRRVGDQRPQVVHLQRPPRQLRHPHRPHRGRPRPAPGGQHGVHRRPPAATAGTRSARSRRCTAARATPRSSSRTCRVHQTQMLGGRGQGHLLGQYRLGPARLAHCMRWIAQAETALDMMVDRSLNRFSHGSLLAEKQGIQWMIADSAIELYQGKLMVLHAAYKIDRGDDFKSEVSMAKHFVANMLNRVIDRSIQVHGALGYSTDTPLADMFQHAALGALRRRRRRGPPDAHRPAHDRRLQGRRHHQGRHRRPTDLTVCVSTHRSRTDVC